MKNYLTQLLSLSTAIVAIILAALTIAGAIVASIKILKAIAG